MVKLTPDLIQQSMQYINPVRDRELDLRGYKIPVIENMGATLDQFDTVDFSDNDIRKLDGFPLLKRLKCLLLNNNRIVRIAEGLELCLPNLETLVLTGNLIQELADLDPLANIKSLRTLSLLHNPVTTRQHYRLYVAFKLPHLRLLDFRKIKLKEREDAIALFKSKKGKELQKEIAKKSKTFVPGAGLPDTAKPSGPSQEELWKIREAISKASSLEEVERLNRLLQSGQIPGRSKSNSKASLVEEEEVEEDDDAMETTGPTLNGK
ncbi:U2 small nuclear ribonucleoprotein A' [Zootermopsis nevadensis]|uniref:Probable U2 small nuclear ribonucleoprotein A' n=1 Tax=Zootermopsis nevadensis TaxID=136037 RepID=A0A067R7N0_ZOONE|nr:U2 small nuclear ribonucleoprotein A' [Zootermopsis nevadensis]XP_021919928.1 U2 small nuclear ribonucleoprotein A' [Zootermopsis nevadensis]XP_021919929.1 U2 small nuclear ribonucleoprotein A' [Zootermopsis nevadensis]XP_021919930.1 U2 small nuclear ribonucleoprotein A' [Zootermopsis nevadensis]XP_021919931.1 U2 small nuclear ribonucleoprotein A' [Zootermopsis nevadensis]KDR19400.1 U2 small nuclear ribonucleoprotein A' [Zootermopsis nevadensis]